MKISELLGDIEKIVKETSTVVDVDLPAPKLLDGFSIWTTNEEAAILKKLKNPVRISALSEHEQFRIAAMIRKDLVTKSEGKDPTIVANEKK